MNRYQPSTPRVTFGIAAAAMTVITFAVLVLVPSMMDSVSDEVGTVAASTVASAVASTVAAPASAEVALSPTRFHIINVVAVREPNTTSTRARSAQPKRRQQG
jgi:hypothetical protein